MLTVTEHSESSRTLLKMASPGEADVSLLEWVHHLVIAFSASTTSLNLTTAQPVVAQQRWDEVRNVSFEVETETNN